MAEGLPEGPEVIFLFGPPFAGKTLFYQQAFLETHERISPWELIKSSDISLRSIILEVVEKLKRGRNVVIDGENAFCETRRSYINLIKHKVPSCEFKCIHFTTHPSNGRTKCCWAREWHISQHSDPTDGHVYDYLSDQERWHSWFKEDKSEIPNESEGFKITKVDLDLLCNSNFKFEIPALLLQWEGLLVRRNNELHCREGVAELIRHWTDSNPTGRVVVVGDGRHTCLGGCHGNAADTEDVRSKARFDDSESHCTCVTDMKRITAQLVEKVDFPIYFVFIKDTSVPSPFIIPPNPGVLAWLQRLHNIGLQHQATLYVCSSESHEKMALSVGVKCLKAKRVLENRNLINAINIRGAQQAPEFLRNSLVVNFAECSSTVRSQDACAQIPLLTEARACNSCTLEVCCVGRVHGLCYKDLASLERYQALYEDCATPSEPASSAVIRSCLAASCKDVARPLVTGAAAKDNQEVLCELPQPLPEEQNSGIKGQEAIIDATNDDDLPPTIKMISKEDVLIQAHSAGHYSRGEGCVRLVKNMRTSLSSDGLTVTCQCSGSQGQTYDVTALIGETGILSASCACPDPASKTGHCKHTVGMLLAYISQQDDVMYGSASLAPSPNSNRPESSIPSKSIESKTKTCSPSVFGRTSAPTAKEENLRSTSHRNSGSVTKTSPRSSKKDGIKRTLYCMSPRELLETAQQFLSEQQEKRVNSREKSKVRPETTSVDLRIKERIVHDEEMSLSDIESVNQRPSSKGATLYDQADTDFTKQRTSSRTRPHSGSHDRETLAERLGPGATSVIPESMEMDPCDPAPSQASLQSPQEIDPLQGTENSEVGVSRRRRRFATKSILDELI